MKKIFILVLLIFSSPAMAIVVSDWNGMCGAYKYDNIYALFQPNSYECAVNTYLPKQTAGCVACPFGFTCSGGTYSFNETTDQGLTLSSYTCDSGYFLPANSDACAACPSGWTCDGGTFYYNATQYQGLVKSATYMAGNENNVCAANYGHKIYAVFEPTVYNCSAGYYLPADGIECVICPTDNICSGGTYTFNETTDQGIVACTAPIPYAPTGSSQCYPHILHVDDGVVYLRSTKLTSPSLHIRIEDDVFYANMTAIPTRMNKDSQRYFHSQWDDNHYYICDDTTYPGE